MTFPLEFDAFAAAFLSLGLVFFLGLWFFYERREAILNQRRRHTTVFHCIKCDLIYTRSRRRETATCPRCGFTNSRLKF
ncbi:MAG: hypothetical protein LBV12_00590 [Puniceicoccales bacterium]|jgi:uncharacterized paraquat-inducible protein A|nr:hypothetical protein [Puniceicoccales bacterium]